MADRLDVEVVNGEVLDAISRAVAEIEQPQQLMELIGGTLKANIEERFQLKVDPSGHAWLPLAPSTLAHKKGRGSILELTGLGIGSLTSNATDQFVEVGFGRDYMGYHETGTQRMPRRSLLADDFNAGTLGAQDQADVVQDIESFLRGLDLAL